MISLLCTLALVLTMAVPGLTARAAGAEQERVINIVYDDSGSMCSDHNQMVDRWSQALYAMEVFATMLGEEDEMNVYLMSNSGASPVRVEGSDPNRVETIVNGLGTTGNTPFATVTNAARDILKEDADKQRWLVVLTDGVFQGESSPETRLAEYAAQGIQVVYLAIDSGANAGIIFQGDPDNGFYAYDAKDSGEVLHRITEIANQIFQQQILPASHITASGTTVTLDVDIPLAQLLVFAQGEGVSVSGMTLNGAPITATESHNVEVTDANTPDGWLGQTLLADGLRGVVQTYTAGGDPFASGTYTFTCSDTSNVEIYYIAGAEIDCHLTYNGVEVKNDEKHYAGEYGVSMRFLDPLTGGELKSDLLDGAVFQAQIKNGADVQTIDASTTSIFLKEGEIELDAWAELPGHVTVHSSHEYTVYPEPIALDISAQIPGEGYKLSALGQNAQPILVTVTNHATGEKLSQEEWEAIGDNLQVSSNANVNWLVTRGSEVATWEIRPDYVTDMTDTDSGSLELAVGAEYEIGTQAAFGAAVFDVVINGYVASELKVEITPGDEPIPLNDLGGAQGALVTLYTKDEYTGELKPLTADQAQAVELTAEASELDWELIPGDSAGTWYLKPKDNADLLLFSGDRVAVVVSGTLADGQLVYQGSDSADIPVIPLTLLEKLMRVIVYVIVLAVFLFFLLGYLCKRKLKFRQMKPYVQNPEDLNRLYVDKKRVLWSYLLPWVAQRAKITCFVPSFHCTFPNAQIRAAGGGSFYISNIQAYNGDRIRLNGKRVDPAKDRKRAFSHVTLTALDEGEDVIGRCHF